MRVPSCLTPNAKNLRTRNWIAQRRCLAAILARRSVHPALLATLALSTGCPAQVVHQHVDWPVPADATGIFIRLGATIEHSTDPTALPGWDLNPRSAVGLEWNVAPGAALQRFQGSAPANLRYCDWVSPFALFGAGDVELAGAGIGDGRWQLGYANYFGFRFVGPSGQTHYGWGRIEIGESLADRRITEIAWNTVGGQGCTVGTGSDGPPNDDPTNPQPIGIDPLAATFSSTTPLACAAGELDASPGCAAVSEDLWYVVETPDASGLLEVELACNTASSLLIYGGAASTDALVDCRLACTPDDPTDPFSTPRLVSRLVQSGQRSYLVRLCNTVTESFPSGSPETIMTRWRPISDIVFLGGSFRFSGSADDPLEGSVAGEGPAGKMGSTSGGGSGSTGSGPVEAAATLALEVAAIGSTRQIRCVGSATASQPPDRGGSAFLSIFSASPLDFVLLEPMNFRLVSQGEPPTLTPITGCICGDRLEAGIYRLTTFLSVQLGNAQSNSSAFMDWRLSLRSTPFPTADVNLDGLVDSADLAALLAAWGSSGPGDLDGNGVVSGSDLTMLLVDWARQ